MTLGVNQFLSRLFPLLGALPPCPPPSSCSFLSVPQVPSNATHEEPSKPRAGSGVLQMLPQSAIRDLMVPSCTVRWPCPTAGCQLLEDRPVSPLFMEQRLGPHFTLPHPFSASPLPFTLTVGKSFNKHVLSPHSVQVPEVLGRIRHDLGRAWGIKKLQDRFIRLDS